MTIARMNQVADELEASGVGYDQGQRWSFLDKVNRAILKNKETDCSAGSGGIAWLAGYPVDISDPFWTGNFKDKMVKAGFSAISVKGEPVAEIYRSVRNGDFLLGPGHVVYIRSNSRWWSAESDERGRASGGKAGDQTGLEARFRAPYARSRGWEWILRPPAESLVAVTPIDEPYHKVTPRAIPVRNVPSDFVRIIQEIVGVKVDGVYGPKTKLAVWQLQAKLKVRRDSKFGPNTARGYLLDQPNMYLGRKGMKKAAIKLVQWIVRSRVDGEWGPLTHADVKGAQNWAGLTPDGNFGPSSKLKIVR